MSPPKHVDLIVLAAAAVLFAVCDFSLLGYITAAVAWLAQRGVQWLAQRRADEALRNGNRQRAMGIIAATTLGRVWLMATIVLVVGLFQNSAGLASAVLLAALFTISMGSSGLAYLLEPEEGHSVQPR
jgi:membrane glycosyltransferase